MNQRKFNNQHFSIPYITCDFVYSKLIHLDISQSTGSDQISAKFLTMVAQLIALALAQIFNLSKYKAEFPSTFKLARVVLPITSLILERHVHLHWKAYLELNSLFYFKQSGFREHHSCQTAIIKIIEDWLVSSEQNSMFIIYRLF